MTAKPVSCDSVVSTSSGLLLTEHVPAYRAYLVDLGHAAAHIEHCEAVIARLDLWMTQVCMCLGDLGEAVIAEFLYQRVPRRRAAVPGRRPDDHHAPLVHLLVVLRNRGTHHAARIHDLRHTFVVRRVLLWQQQGVDVDQAMLSLSTYLGHAGVADTYWYLQAVPDLMAVAAKQFDACMPEECDA